MVREKIDKIKWIGNECHLKVGFEDEKGKWTEKMIPINILTDFIDNTFDLNEYCAKTKESRRY